MPTAEQIDLLLGPLGLTFALLIAVLAFATGRVVGKGTADAREAAAVKRGDEWKALSEKQTEAAVRMADALDKNTEAIRKSAETTEALVGQNQSLIEQAYRPSRSRGGSG